MLLFTRLSSLAWCKFEKTPSSIMSILESWHSLFFTLLRSRLYLSPCSPKDVDGSNFDRDKVDEFFNSLFADLTVDREENAEMLNFFASENTPPVDDLIGTRASAFRIGCDYLTDDREKNTELFRCINAAVHAIEMSCFSPKPYALAMEVPPTISVEAIGLDASIEKAVQHLWDLDANRLKPGVDYVLNVQGGKKPYSMYFDVVGAFVKMKCEAGSVV